MHFRPAAAWFPRSFLTAACLLCVVLALGPSGHAWAQSTPAPTKPEGEMRFCVCATATYGNAASRIAEHVPSTGTYAYGGYPDIDALYKEQALVSDPLLTRTQHFQLPLHLFRVSIPQILSVEVKVR